MTAQPDTALVTGASRGIGRAIALALADSGYALAVNYAADAAAAAETVRLVNQRGARALAIQADVSDLAQVKNMIVIAEREIGPIVVLVNNAGIVRDNYLRFMKDEEWDRVLDVNLKGAFYCIKAVSRGMARRKRGAVVNISSDAALLGDLMRANYAAAKSGLLGLTRTAAREMGVAGIRVNAVAPGLIETALIREMPEAKRKKLMRAIPMSRFGQPEEVAKAVVFLASSRAGFIHGQVLCVDGGMKM